MTEASTLPRPHGAVRDGAVRDAAAQSAARPAFAGLRTLGVPAHVGVIMGLSAGAYALSLAAVTGLQSSTEAGLAADRAPAIAEIDVLQRDHLELERRLESAKNAYQEAAAAYSSTGDGFAAMEAKLGNLATLMTEINGTAASLPTSVRLPAVSRNVSGGSAPAVHATTTASGG